MTELNINDLDVLAGHEISPERALKIDTSDWGGNQESDRSEAIASLNKALELLMPRLRELGVDESAVDRQTPLLQRWLLMQSCHKKFAEIVAQAKNIDQHVLGGGAKLHGEHIVIETPIAGSSIAEIAVPNWKETIFGIPLSFSIKLEGANSSVLTGQSNDKLIFAMGGFGRDLAELVRRIFKNEAHTLPIGHMLAAGAAAVEVCNNLDHGSKDTEVGVSMSDDVVSATLEKSGGWNEFLGAIACGFNLEFSKAVVSCDSLGKKTLKLKIPKMQTLISDELILEDGVPKTLEPRSADQAGFYSAEVLYKDGTLRIQYRAKANNSKDFSVAMPEINYQRVNEGILNLLLQANEILTARLAAMSGLYVQPDRLEQPQSF